MSTVPSLRRSLVLSAIGIAACTDPSIDAAHAPPTDVPPAAIVYLPPTAHLVRASLALRGTRPSIEDLEAVRADPTKLAPIVDHYVSSKEFGETVRHLHNEAILVRTDPRDYPFGFPAWAPLEQKAQSVTNRSLQEAPLRLIEHVIMNDRPYSEIITADYTMANRIVASVWGLEYHGARGRDVSWDDDSEWVVTKWPDGRPTAGILSDSAFYTRWTSNAVNANRSRANAVSKSLLCYDFLSREVVIDGTVNLADPDAVNDAVVANATCASCHQTLDPLAQYFRPYFIEPFGYLAFVQREKAPTYPHQGIYDAPGQFVPTTNRTPGYFGMAARDLGGVGGLIAADPRFSLCAAKRFYAYLAHVDLEDVPLDVARDLQRRFIDDKLDAKRLAKAVVLSDAFRVSHATTDEPKDAGGLKMVRPEQLARLIEDLTGFRWRYLARAPQGPAGIIDALDDPGDGFKVLAGGIDSYYVVRSTRTMNTTASLVLRDVALRAAKHVVDSDFAIADKKQRRLFSEIDPGETDEARIRAQVVRLHLRLFGDFVEQASEAITETVELLRASSRVVTSEREAWAVVLATLLQDPRIVYF